MKKYGRELMCRAGYPGSRINKVVESLADDFPDHSYIIDAREAKELGLNTQSTRADLSPFVEQMVSTCGYAIIAGRISEQNGS
jgi:hypothetical protein